MSSYKHVQSENVLHCLVFVYFFNKIGIMLNVSYGICDVSIHLIGRCLHFSHSLTQNSAAAEVFACSFYSCRSVFLSLDFECLLHT